MRPQPLVVCRSVEASSRFHVQHLGCRSTHEGEPFEYDRLVDPRSHPTGGLILQLHARDQDHHHGHVGDPAQPVGNGCLLWFEVDDFDAAVERARGLGARVIPDVHWNPNAEHRELGLADPDGSTVVLAAPDGEDPALAGGR